MTLDEAFSTALSQVGKRDSPAESAEITPCQSLAFPRPWSARGDEVREE